jgi:hypothetical protein
VANQQTLKFLRHSCEEIIENQISGIKMLQYEALFHIVVYGITIGLRNAVHIGDVIA